MNNLIIVLIAFFLLTGCQQVNKNQIQGDNQEFTFLFMTDIHMRPGDARTAFNMVIDTANTMGADFILTGGDLIFDAMRGNVEKSDSLFLLYKEAVSHFTVPVYHCIGNHDLFGIYEVSPTDSTHPDYKSGMFERHLGDSYYSFDHKGWHFMVLNSFETENYAWKTKFGEKQLSWIREDLGKIRPETPVAVVVHVPLITVYDQYHLKEDQDPVVIDIFDDMQEFFTLFSGYNLKLVLQGHKHWIEDINVRDKTRFITGGSIAGRPSWGTPSKGDEGFMKFTVSGEEISWNYIQYRKK